MNEMRGRNLDAGETQTIADLTRRERCSDITMQSISDLETRTAYTPDIMDTETTMPDLPPVHKKRKKEVLPEVIVPIPAAIAEEPPLASVDPSGKVAPPSSPIESPKVEKPISDCSDGDGQKIRKIAASDMADILLAMDDFAMYQDQLYLYSANEGYWSLIPESEANRKLRAIIPEAFVDIVNKNVLTEIYEWLLVRAKRADKKAGEHRHLLNFQDCAVDWRTGDVIRDRKKLFFRYALQVRYRDLPTSSTGAYKSFLDDIFGKDEKTKKEFRKFMGLCLSDIRTLKLCFFLFGSSNTGKSVILNLLKRIVGAEWCSSLSFTQMGNEFALTQLVGKRLNLSGEVSGASNKRLDIFKSLTGNDSITACFKGKDHFQFINEALLVFACNDFPPVHCVTEFDSFLARIIIFPFANVKPRSEWIENLEDVLLKDVGAIIADAIKGLKELDENYFQIKETDAMQAAKREFTGRYNSFALFADEYLERDIDGVLTSEEIRSRYYEYCQEEDFVPLSDNMWSILLMNRFGCIKTTASVEKEDGIKRIRGYKGVRWSDSDKFMVKRR